MILFSAWATKKIDPKCRIVVQKKRDLPDWDPAGTGVNHPEIGMLLLVISKMQNEQSSTLIPAVSRRYSQKFNATNELRFPTSPTKQ